MRSARVTWREEEETTLIHLYALASHDPSLRSAKGLKPKGWAWVATEMEARHGSTKDKSSLQSKCMRLLNEYKLHRSVRALPGVSQGAQDGRLQMKPEAWDRLFAKKKADASVLRRFRASGFPFLVDCAVACWDEDTLKECGTSLDAYLSSADRPVDSQKPGTDEDADDEDANGDSKESSGERGEEEEEAESDAKETSEGDADEEEEERDSDDAKEGGEEDEAEGDHEATESNNEDEDEKDKPDDDAKEATKKQIKWDPTEEATLLTLYIQARQKATLRSDEGLTKKGWKLVLGELYARHQSVKKKIPVRIQFAQLLGNYKLYREVCALDGAKRDSKGRVVMAYAAWNRVVAKRQADALVLRNFRTTGFPLAVHCAAACNDEEALKEYGTSMDAFVASIDHRRANGNQRKQSANDVVATNNIEHKYNTSTDTRAPTATTTQRTRASWTSEEEKSLLQLYAMARQNPLHQNTNGYIGLSAKGWEWIGAEMTSRHGSIKDKDSLFSKHARLQRDYRVYRSILGLDGATCDQIGGPIICDAQMWERIIAGKKVDASTFRRFKTHGFPLVVDCAAASEDAEALSEYKTSMRKYLASVTNVASSSAKQAGNGSKKKRLSSTSVESIAAHDSKPGASITDFSRAVPMDQPASGTKRKRVSRQTEGLEASNAPRNVSSGDTNGPRIILSGELEHALMEFLDAGTAFFRHKMPESM